MRNSKIYIQESIEKKRIIRETFQFEKISNFGSYAGSVIIIITLGGLKSLALLQDGVSSTNASLVFYGSLVLSGLVIYFSMTMDKLKRIKGINQQQNRRIIKEIVKEFGWEIRYDEKTITVANKVSKLFPGYLGPDIIIIYNHNDILINCISYFGPRWNPDFDIKLPFSWIGNRLNERMFFVKFEEKTESNDTPTSAIRHTAISCKHED